MQRIDENTYIDDTLVTCAEYQLFIDDRKESGYFPYQWSLPRYPVGQAYAPILGINAFQAEQFCGWLTQQETRRWRYRLPTTTEASDFPLKIKTQSPLGYWTTERIFIWVNAKKDDIRPLNISIIRELALEIAGEGKRNLSQELARDLYLDILELRKRLADRSRAVEGIRLVKYRE